MVRCARALALVAALAFPRAAWAQGDDARAEQLFREGFEALEAQDYTVACSKLAESLALARKVGTVLNLARCEDARGRRAEARALFREGLDLLDPSDDRRALAEERFEVLDKSVPALDLRLASGAPPDTVVSAGGQQWIVGPEGVTVRINAGSYVLEVQAEGRKKRSTPLTLRESERVILTVEPGEPIAADKEPVVPPPVPPPATPPPEEDGFNAPAWICLGVGAAGLVAAGITGAMVLSDEGTVDDDCQDGICGSQDGVDAASRGETLLVVNAVAWGVGIVGIGAGAAFFLWGGDDAGTASAASLAPRASPDGAGMLLQGRF